MAQQVEGRVWELMGHRLRGNPRSGEPEGVGERRKKVVGLSEMIITIKRGAA